MRINAYVLAADPAYIESSVLSYYDLVAEIVVSYDEAGLGWTGQPVETQECLRRLRAVDSAGKLRFHAGSYARLDHEPMENETFQRQQALDVAGHGADWVLQLDTDEVIPNLELFADCVTAASDGGFEALNYPARWLYRQVGPRTYLERCDRLWRRQASYPGPVAVRSGTALKYARQTPAPAYHVDFDGRRWSPAFGGTPVHRGIRPRDSILHYSWVRSEEEMDRKAASSGHTGEHWLRDEVEQWKRHGRHPYAAALASHFGPRRVSSHLRLSRLPPER